MHARQHHICTLNPVQRRVTKHGIESSSSMQIFAAHSESVRVQLPRSFDLRNTGIDRNHFTAQINQLFR